MKDFFRSAIIAVSCLVFTLALSAAGVVPGGSLQSYLSRIDDSRQYYGLYVPENYSLSHAYPVIFTGHGFGGGVSSYFSEFQQQYAATNECLLVQLNGRGNTFYDGVGEVDFFDVLADLSAKCPIDKTRLFFEGGSMGATGAFRLGLRHPDILAGVAGADGWGDYRFWYPQWYGPKSNPAYVSPCRLSNLLDASPVDIAENGMWQNMYLAADANDTTVWEQNTLNLAARLTELAKPAPLTTYLHILFTGTGGHEASYNQEDNYNYFLTLPSNRVPHEVVIKTMRLKDGKIYWASIDRLQQWNTMALLDAKITGTVLAVTSSNVTQCTFKLDAALFPAGKKIITITMNGATCYRGAVQPLTLYAKQDSTGKIINWSTLPPVQRGLVKKDGLEGPIGDAYNSRFLVVYGNAADLSEASTFCAHWNQWMHASIVPHPAASVTQSQINTCNLFLFGTSDSNPLTAKIQPGLPIQVTNTTIRLGKTHFTGNHYGAYFIYPNPLNPHRYVVISHLLVPGALPKDLEALPWYWPDYVIYDTNKHAGVCIQSNELNYLPDTFVDAGYFDINWKLP